MECFIDAMRNAGIEPSNPSAIKADDKRHDYQIAGDPKSKRKGFYKLKISGDFGVGFFGDYRQGDYQGWHSTAPVKYTRAEREAFRKRLEAEKAMQEREQQKEWDDHAREAADAILFLDPAIDHPYIAAKGVCPYEAFISGDDLIIPMYGPEKLYSLQYIKPDGTKLFMNGVAGAKKQGTFLKIPGDGDDAATICMVEGWATGCSVRDATGYTVYVCWDAGNLPVVAPYVRRQHPEARIIVCADNDALTVDKQGEKTNPGIAKGKQAALSIKADLIYPEFEKMSSLTDFNDLHRKSGLEAVENRIRQAAPPKDGERGDDAAGGVTRLPGIDSQSKPPGCIPSDPQAWQDDLIRNEKGVLSPASIHNAILFLENDPVLQVFRYNEFKSDIFITKAAPWEAADKFSVRRVENVDLTRCEAFLESYAALKPGATRLAGAIEAAAEKNRFHPVRDYFNGLEWDGKPRVALWLRDYAGALYQPPEYLECVGTKWLAAAVARVFDPGCKFDHMLVLEGPQNAGKSMLLRILGTFGRDIEETYYTDSVNISTIEERGSILKLQGSLIIEFPELAGLGKKDQDELKRWITLQADEVEIKFKQRTQILPRQFILAGTYNPVAGIGWLTDPTGGRRFWPVITGTKINLEKLKDDREQLWAEAAHIYRQGIKLYVEDTDPVYAMLKKEQEDRGDTDLWFDEVMRVIGEKTQWTSSEMLEKIGIPIGKQNNRTDKARISKIFSQIGWTYQNTRRSGTQLKAWVKIQDQKTFDNEEDVKW